MSFFQIAVTLLLLQYHLYIGETGYECLVCKNSLQKAGHWKPLVFIDKVDQFQTLVFFVENTQSSLSAITPNAVPQDKHSDLFLANVFMIIPHLITEKSTNSTDFKGLIFIKLIILMLFPGISGTSVFGLPF